MEGFTVKKIILGRGAVGGEQLSVFSLPRLAVTDKARGQRVLKTESLAVDGAGV